MNMPEPQRFAWQLASSNHTVTPLRKISQDLDFLAR